MKVKDQFEYNNILTDSILQRHKKLKAYLPKLEYIILPELKLHYFGSEASI